MSGDTELTRSGARLQSCQMTQPSQGVQVGPRTSAIGGARPVVSIIRLLLLTPILALAAFIWAFTRPVTGPFITGAKLELLDARGRPTRTYEVEDFGDESCVDLVTTTGESFSIGTTSMRITFPNGKTRAI